MSEIKFSCIENRNSRINVLSKQPERDQSDFSFRKLILKINDFILCITFSILVLFYINRVFLDTVIIC